MSHDCIVKLDDRIIRSGCILSVEIVIGDPFDPDPVDAYVLAHGLPSSIAQAAVLRFNRDPSLLVELGPLYETTTCKEGAVRLFWSDTPGFYLHETMRFGILRSIPGEALIRREEWLAFVEDFIASCPSVFAGISTAVGRGSRT